MPRKTGPEAEIRVSAAFRHALRRLRRRQEQELLAELETVISLLCQYLPLPARYHAHPLQGSYRGCMECHLRPDLLLMYRYAGNCLELLRLGTHREVLGI